MLSYFEKSKGRITISEDSLTGMVFDYLKYLPAEIFWRILKRALYYDKLPAVSGEFIDIQFWEKCWRAELSKGLVYVSKHLLGRKQKTLYHIFLNVYN